MNTIKIYGYHETSTDVHIYIVNVYIEVGGILKGLKRLLKIYHLKGQVQRNHILPIHAFWVMRDIYGGSKTFDNITMSYFCWNEYI